MVDWTLTPRTATVARLTAVPADLRLMLRQGPFDRAGHDRWFDPLACLREIEIGGVTPGRAGVAGAARVIFWNVERIAQGGPVLPGGDFNTSTGSHEERANRPDEWRARVAAEPMRLLRPARHEPLFAVAEKFGYDWQSCNEPDQATTRYPAGSPRLPARIDWFLACGLRVSDPGIIPALRPDGTPSSDHEALIVTVHPAGG